MKYTNRTPSVTKSGTSSFHYGNFPDEREFTLTYEVTFHWSCLEEEKWLYPKIQLEELKINGALVPFVTSFIELNMVLSELLLEEFIYEDLEISFNEEENEHRTEKYYKDGDHQLFNGYFHQWEAGFILPEEYYSLYSEGELEEEAI